MDIQGLVNHPNHDDNCRISLTPTDHSGSDSARSQIPAEASISGIPYPSPYHLQPLDQPERSYSPHYQLLPNIDRIESPPLKRPLERQSPSLLAPPAKKRDANSEGKSMPPRRRALQACEACRAKKSKCDNERPSCGSCVQHNVECVYKGTPIVPVYLRI